MCWGRWRLGDDGQEDDRDAEGYKSQTTHSESGEHIQELEGDQAPPDQVSKGGLGRRATGQPGDGVESPLVVQSGLNLVGGAMVSHPLNMLAGEAQGLVLLQQEGLAGPPRH